MIICVTDQAMKMASERYFSVDVGLYKELFSVANLLSEQQNFSHNVRIITTSGKRGMQAYLETERIFNPGTITEFLCSSKPPVCSVRISLRVK